MKVAPIFVSKNTMLKKIAERKAGRIFCHTSVELTPEIKKQAEPLIDSLSRYANKEDIIYGFRNADNNNLEVIAFLRKGDYFPIPDKAFMRTIVNPKDNLHEISNKIKEDTVKSYNTYWRQAHGVDKAPLISYVG